MENNKAMFYAGVTRCLARQKEIDAEAVAKEKAKKEAELER